MNTRFHFLSARNGKVRLLRNERKRDSSEILTICEMNGKHSLTIKRPDEDHSWETAKVNAFMRLASGCVSVNKTKGLFVLPEMTTIEASAQRAGFKSAKELLVAIGNFLNK